MIHTATNYFSLRLTAVSLFFTVFGLFSGGFGIEANAQAQNARPKASSAFSEPSTQQPPYSDYKGVRIGMTTDEARAKLGQPTREFENQDLYVISATETVQVYFDDSRKITAIAVDYLGTTNAAPACKAIVGADIQTKPDGSMYKLVRYEHLGFWVSFNRTAGDVPIITVTMQKLK